MDPCKPFDPRRMVPATKTGKPGQLNQEEQLARSLSRFLTYDRYKQERYVRERNGQFIKVGDMKIVVNGTHCEDERLGARFKMPPELEKAVEERLKIKAAEENLKKNKKSAF